MTSNNSSVISWQLALLMKEIRDQRRYQSLRSITSVWTNTTKCLFVCLSLSCILNPLLSVSLDCPFLIFPVLYLESNVVCISGLSILDFPLGFLYCFFYCVHLAMSVSWSHKPKRWQVLIAYAELLFCHCLVCGLPLWPEKHGLCLDCQMYGLVNLEIKYIYSGRGGLAAEP